MRDRGRHTILCERDWQTRRWADFILALKKFAELNLIDTPSEPTFNDVLTKYVAEALPKLAFLNKHSDKPTTANRCKRLVSAMWNLARGWGDTDLPNPCEGIRGHSLPKRTVYITDEVFAVVRRYASEPLQDAMDLAYLTGQRPVDALSMSEHDIADGLSDHHANQNLAALKDCRHRQTGGTDRPDSRPQTAA